MASTRMIPPESPIARTFVADGGERHRDDGEIGSGDGIGERACRRPRHRVECGEDLVARRVSDAEDRVVPDLEAELRNFRDGIMRTNSIALVGSMLTTNADVALAIASRDLLVGRDGPGSARC